MAATPNPAKDQRKRENGWTTLPNEGPDTEPPALIGAGFDDRARDLWAHWWSTPMARIWCRFDAPVLENLLKLTARTWEPVEKDEDGRVINSVTGVEHANRRILDEAAAIALDGGNAAVRGQHVTWGAMALHDAVRFGRARLVADALADAVGSTRGAHLLETMADHGRALAERSAEGLDDAAHRFAAHGAWLLAAEAMAHRATVLEEQDAPAGARAAAVSHAWESRCQSPGTPALTARPRSLSARAMEIAFDAARGISSAAIAERRFISVRTVDNHLGAAYRALGLGGRDDLAQLLGSHLAADPE